MKAVASLRLTVVCLSLAMVLIFAGTLDQVNLGIHEVQKKYFQSIFVFWQVPGSTWKLPVLPGGYLLGGVILLNLITAHAVRFRCSWKKLGLLTAHAGLIILLLGELGSGMLSQESQMRLNEGEAKDYSEDMRHTELAVIDTTNPNYDQVTAIPEAVLRKTQQIKHPSLPFSIRVQRFMKNSRLALRTEAPPDWPPATVTAGLGKQLAVIEVPQATKMDERDISTALLEIDVENSTETWLVSNVLPEPQSFSCNGRTFTLILRQKRFYRPFSIQLLDFQHERYPGSDIPKNFSSRIHLVHLEQHEDREYLIYMNHPLRYSGLSFFQAGFENDDQTSILQVVQNPVWLIPYISCLLISLGLTFQFAMHLCGFISRRTPL